MAQPSSWQNLFWWKDFAYSLGVLPIAPLLPSLKPKRVDLSGKTAVVTGANSGIGLELAIELAAQGATVYLACRDESKAQKAIQDLSSRIPKAKQNVRFLLLDVSSFASVRSFAETWSRQPNNKIDILCHNAGIAKYPEAQEFSVDGFEITYATNLLGSFLLTHLLEAYLTSTARVIFTSSTSAYLGNFSTDFKLGPLKDTCEPGFHCPIYPLLGSKIVKDDAGSRYGNTKAMQVVLAKLLQNRFDHQARIKDNDCKQTAHAFSPGFTMTPIYGKMENTTLLRDPLFATLKLVPGLSTNVSQGAATGLWLATTNDENVIGRGKGGGYWDRMARCLNLGDVLSDEMMDRLWTRWERMPQLNGAEKRGLQILSQGVFEPLP